MYFKIFSSFYSKIIFKENKNQRKNFFNFDNSHTSLKYFDISQCYKTDETIQMKFTIPYKSSFTKMKIIMY